MHSSAFGVGERKREAFSVHQQTTDFSVNRQNSINQGAAGDLEKYVQNYLSSF